MRCSPSRIYYIVSSLFLSSFTLYDSNMDYLIRYSDMFLFDKIIVLCTAPIVMPYGKKSEYLVQIVLPI